MRKILTLRTLLSVQNERGEEDLGGSFCKIVLVSLQILVSWDCGFWGIHVLPVLGLGFASRIKRDKKELSMYCDLFQNYTGIMNSISN